MMPLAFSVSDTELSFDVLFHEGQHFNDVNSTKKKENVCHFEYTTYIVLVLRY